jgi:hypothetical protein
MPSPKDDRFQPEPPVPVRPPTLPPDFPDIPQNPSSELQPPPDPAARPDKIEGTTPAPMKSETLGQPRPSDELRHTNARLRDRINEILEAHPELRDTTDEIALHQALHVEVGTPVLERIQGKLQERARAIIERRPDLEHFFDD